MHGKDFEAISQWTGVNTGCSGCEWGILAFVKALMNKGKQPKINHLNLAISCRLRSAAITELTKRAFTKAACTALIMQANAAMRAKIVACIF